MQQVVSCAEGKGVFLISLAILWSSAEANPEYDPFQKMRENCIYWIS